MNVTHFVSYESLETLQDGLRVFGEVPPSRKGLFDLFEYMKYDVRPDAVKPSGNAMRKLLKRQLHRKGKRSKVV